ncbi:GNAT family N-acetyltransferase [Spirillospora sp. CA-128828]|uniref:GNAT family N-acetyltransferase n=1 Tax=Spirillospora sp. CA-128828 TaxID=3240033 RepID=UPI003D8E64D2
MVHLARRSGLPFSVDFRESLIYRFIDLVAVDGSGIVGWLQGQLEASYRELIDEGYPSPHASIMEMVVEPTRRREGIGRGLVVEFVRRARRERLSAIGLNVMAGSPKEVDCLVQFYTSLGMQKVYLEAVDQTRMIGDLNQICARFST